MRRKDYIIDNKTNLLKNQIISLSKNSKKAKIATGYFYLNGYRLVSESFENLENMELIVGNEIAISLNPEKNESYRQLIKENMLEDLASVDDVSLRKQIKELHEILKSDKAEVRIYNKGNLHSKLYIFLGENNTAIVGSSNFTKPGLEDNVELNIIEKKDEKVEELTAWFNEIWENETEPFREDMIQIIESSGLLSDKFVRWGHYLPPQELFKILAYEILDGRVDLVKEKKILTLFQDVGVLNAENKITKYYGCLVADSVGLGKSFIGAEIIKDFFYGKKDFWDQKLELKWKNKGKGCLLIVPAHLKHQWRDEVLLTNFFSNCLIKPIDGEYHFKLIDKSIGELGNVKIISDSKFSRENVNSLQHMSNLFDLILIDEAHRFRNENTNAWNNIQLLKKKSDYKEESGQNVSEGIRNRFILLSATPLNNRISDLINIFKIFIDRDLRDLTRQGKNVKIFSRYEYLKDQLKTNPGNKKLKTELKESVQKIKNEILDDLMILRTRKYIRDSERYKSTKINGEPLIFKDPNVKKVKYDKDLKKYDNDYLNLYNGLADFLGELEYPYVDLFLIEDSRKLNLRTLMKILLLKRIESSIYSFDISIQRMEDKEKFLIKLLNKYSDIGEIKNKWREKYGGKQEEEDGEELGILLDEQSVDSEGKPKLNVEELKEKALNDLKLIKEFKGKINRIKSDSGKYNDPKLVRLKNELNQIFSNGGEIPKIILFSQFKDTANYIHDELNEWISKSTNHKLRKLELEKVTGDVDILTKERRLKRFAPIANDYDLREGEEIDFLISTDALSEGVNIQDASIVVNYDLPWNPMRIVQRVGRVNRIGSTKDIFVYNFFPDRDLEELLKLLKKLGDKIEDVQNLLAKEMQILSDEEDMTVDTIGETIKNEREETDITKLESNIRSSDFKSADVYGEDEETIQKLRIIDKLKDLRISDDEFRELNDSLKKIPYYSITENGKIVRLYRIWDKKRKEKMRNFLIEFDDTETVSVPFDSIIEFADIKDGKRVVNLETDDLNELKRKILRCDSLFEENQYKQYTQLFIPMRQGQLQSFAGIHRKIVRHLRALTRTRRLQQTDEEETNRLLRIRHIYESMNLRSNEVRELKMLFTRSGIDVERANLSDIKPIDIVKVLEAFFDEYLSTKPDTYFGGIRTNRDLEYEVIGWQA